MSQVEGLNRLRSDGVMWSANDGETQIKKNRVEKENDNQVQDHEYEKSSRGNEENINTPESLVGVTRPASAAVNGANRESMTSIQLPSGCGVEAGSLYNSASGSVSTQLALVEQHSDRGSADGSLTESSQSDQSHQKGGGETEIVQSPANRNVPPSQTLLNQQNGDFIATVLNLDENQTSQGGPLQQASTIVNDIQRNFTHQNGETQRSALSVPQTSSIDGIPLNVVPSILHTHHSSDATGQPRQLTQQQRATFIEHPQSTQQKSVNVEVVREVDVNDDVDGVSGNIEVPVPRLNAQPPELDVGGDRTHQLNETFNSDRGPLPNDPVILNEFNVHYFPGTQPLQEINAAQLNRLPFVQPGHMHPQHMGANHPLVNVGPLGLVDNLRGQNANGAQQMENWMDPMMRPVQRPYHYWPPLIVQAQQPLRNEENRQPPPPDNQRAADDRNNDLHEMRRELQEGFSRVERGIRVIAGRQARHRDPPPFLKFASNQSLTAFENATEDDYQHLVTYLSQIGGSDVKKVTAGMIRATLSTDNDFVMNVTITRRVEGKFTLRTGAARYLRAILTALRCSSDYARITEREFYSVMSSQLKAVKECHRQSLGRL
ncbi:uncharacterized protein [Fopius arisanus]|uniref:ITIH1 protein n=2 Tax=Fopius arisanus TaxID=64838 RepID=A0A9R1SUC5_9HYME|nr:PREDICTED: uncharacterized protein LOC105263058 [Fopius arisanus]